MIIYKFSYSRYGINDDQIRYEFFGLFHNRIQFLRLYEYNYPRDIKRYSEEYDIPQLVEIFEMLKDTVE